ncbi:MAG TPA: carbon monoxide dehydrogenase subunit G [Anaerolineales bacterium]|nr:carbon monoxide dehydrogenase subunit G [Anaerolineales bacterium]
MQFSGTETIKAGRAKVWEFVTDPNQVGQCAPGLESLQIVEPGKKFKATISVGFGAVKAKFAMDAEWQELSADDGKAVLKARGKAPGSAVEIVARMNLTSESADQTRLDWSADVNIMGTIAAIASRMAQSVTATLTAQFFRCLKSKIEA